jgi:drug/metabolite transporter (DMT)-like permease
VETLPPLTVAAVRAGLGALLLAALLGPRLRDWWHAAREGDYFLSQALFNVVLPWTLVAWASRIIDAKLTTILNSLSPIFIFLITWAITRHEPATGRKFLGVVLGLAGVATIVGPSALAGLGSHLAAELACVAGSLGYGIAAVIGRRYDRLPALVPAAGSLITGAAILLPLAAAVDGVPSGVSTRSLLAVLALAVFSTGAAFVVYFRLLSTIGSIATASQAYLRIVIGVGLSVALLGETLEPAHWIGLALVVAGVVAMTFRRKTL